MIAERIRYEDLLRKPFAWGARGPDSFDCLGLLYEVLRRAGFEIPEEIEVAAYGSDSKTGARKALAAGFDSYWQLVGHRPGSATRIGDAIYSSPNESVHHVSTIVWAQAPRVALTTSLGARGVRAVQASSIRDVVAVYRFRGAA